MDNNRIREQRFMAQVTSEANLGHAGDSDERGVLDRNDGHKLLLRQISQPCDLLGSLVVGVCQVQPERQAGDNALVHADHHLRSMIQKQTSHDVQSNRCGSAQ